MQHLSVELIGYAAAAASLYAANSKTIIPLRYAAIAANALAIIYSSNHGTYPTVMLNAVLLPLNAIRLRSMIKLIRDVDAAAKTDMNVDWLLKYMSPTQLKAGEVFIQARRHRRPGVLHPVRRGRDRRDRQDRRQRHAAGRNRPVHRRRPAHHDGALQDRRARRRPSRTTASRNCTSRTRSSASPCCAWWSRACTATNCSSPRWRRRRSECSRENRVAENAALLPLPFTGRGGEGVSLPQIFLPAPSLTLPRKRERGRRGRLWSLCGRRAQSSASRSMTAFFSRQ